jgi:acyl-CoA oxidase
MVCTAYVNYNAAFSIKNGVHWFLYMKTLFNLGTAKHSEYIQKAIEYKDIGCFGLTELLHGSNVRGVLTEAHYDHQLKSFIMNSPTKDAMKFWIGAAGNIANISVIWAQLYV